MGSFISVQAEIDHDCREDILRIAKEKFGLTECHYYDWEDGTGTIIFNTYFLGYAEPVELYEMIKDMVKDVHYVDIGCAVDNQSDEEHTDIKVWSCKLEYNEGLHIEGDEE